MTKSRTQPVDSSDWFDALADPFHSLDTKDLSSWPKLLKFGLYLLVVIVVVVALWSVWLSDAVDKLTLEQTKEVKLRGEYKAKLSKAVALESLKKQREQVQQYVTQLEKQLPSKAEMGALLSDINQAGSARSLQFDLFRPGEVVVREYYAELPIAVRVTGQYHDIGSFAADISNLSRIVTISSMSIAPARDGTLTMDAVAKTFRYLDAQEVNAQRKLDKGAKK